MQRSPNTHGPSTSAPEPLMSPCASQPPSCVRPYQWAQAGAGVQEHLDRFSVAVRGCRLKGSEVPLVAV